MSKPAEKQRIRGEFENVVRRIGVFSWATIAALGIWIVYTTWTTPTPMKAKGTENMIVNGCAKLSKSDAITM